MDYFKLASSTFESEVSEHSTLLGKAESLLTVLFPIGFMDINASSGFGLGAVPPYMSGIWSSSIYC